MCGIVGYVGSRPAQQIIIDGLKRLEYRGYDSAGIAVLVENGEVGVRREVGKLENLTALLAQAPLSGQIGLGHTRWATHGAPSQRNAHPHKSMNGRVTLVHNGIVENFLELRDELAAEGVRFESDTDTEDIAQLIERHLEAGVDLVAATRRTLRRLNGSNAVVVFSVDQPDRLLAARLGNAGGITVGVGRDEMFIASDIPAILEHTRDMVFLDSRQMVIVRRGGFEMLDVDTGAVVTPEVINIPWDPVSAIRGEYKHFMQKEIFEQPRAIIDTLRGRADFERGEVELPEMNLSRELVQRLEKVIIVACGTSYYSGLIGKFLIEALARIPTEVAYASEFRYTEPLVPAHCAVLSITQSGETADTLAASDLARQHGATTWAIVNVIGSQAMRLADGHIPMRAGPEIGVASTKAFTTSIVDQYLLACALGRLRGTLSRERLARLLDDLARLPDLAGRVLDGDDDYQEIAARYFKRDNFLYLGRGINYPVAREGALKLKEISYIHAEGYPAGEMKHGPIALIDETMPVVAIATQDHVYDKMLSQIEQARARGGTVIAVATEGDEALAGLADDVIAVPATPPLLSPVVNVLPLQLLAYHIAVRRGCDVDQPRNLAKSVTVE